MPGTMLEMEKEESCVMPPKTHYNPGKTTGRISVLVGEVQSLP